MSVIAYDSSAFERLGFHDVCVYAIVPQRPESQGNLVLDIDFIDEWREGADGRFSFLVAPATLTFIDVVDLQIHLDWGKSAWQEEPYGTMYCPSGELVIYGISRTEYKDLLYVKNSLLQCEINFSVPDGGKISLGARDFKLVGRQDAVWSKQQIFDPVLRAPFIVGG